MSNTHSATTIMTIFAMPVVTCTFRASVRLLAAALISVWALLPLSLQALPTDSQQPINIQSNKASQKAEGNNEKTEYFGNVLMTQGSMKIQGEHVVINSENRKVTTIIATGTPASFEQQSNLETPPIKAQANTIRYQLKNETITLLEQASIEQDGSLVSGEEIKYNIAAERVNASGGNTDDTRVNMVLMPSAKKTEPEQKADDVDTISN